MAEIVKVQRPIGGGGPCLVYAKGHSRAGEVPLDGAAAKALGSDYKVFMFGTWDAKSGWTLEGKAPWQGW